ncbi:mRNA splicing protein prp28 [Coemansia sp. RSA 988]|nr:mRNA splicing protein prp28 [Coemansia sp. RSA 988]
MDFDSKKSVQRSQVMDVDDDEGDQPGYIDPFAASRISSDAAANVSKRANNHNTLNNGQPMSVEEAVQLKNQRAEPSQPVFLTKAQRAKLALERRQREADEMRRQRAEEIHQLQGIRKKDYEENSNNRAQRSESRGRSGASRRDHSPSANARRRSRSPDTRRRSRSRSVQHRNDRYRDRDDPREESSRTSRHGDRYYRPSRTARSRSRSPTESISKRKGKETDDEFAFVGRESTDGTGDRVLTSKECEAIRKRYSQGDQLETRGQRKQGSRKVKFDWDASEDTSRDINDLYQSRTTQQQNVLFGRGRIAGVVLENASTLSPTAVGNSKDYDRARRVHERQRKALWDERHWREKPLDEMRDRDWRIFKEDFSISCKGGKIPYPYRSWNESNIPKEILRAIEDIGYRDPTPIQRQAIPIGMQNRDLIGIAETGSGKTASFLIPMLAFIMTRPPLNERNMADGPYALILAPTRELAQQIESETHKFARRLGFRSVSIVGGHDIEQQALALRHGAEIIIATPGRLRDCIDRRVLVLNQCTYVVMDEADRMVDMGFEEDVNFILDALPVSNTKPEDYEENSNGGLAERFKYRQTTMFSATMPPIVERMARKYLRKPATVTIGEAGKAVDTVEQRAEFVVGEERRKKRLLHILNQHANNPPIIVFVNQKKNVDLLGQALTRARYSVATLHGGKSQEQREQSLARLRSGEIDILVATDVAGRGIDIKDVSLVVNFDMAKDIESYTHRIGRTGRAGKRGLAITFLNPADDRDVLYDLRKAIAASPISRCPPELASHEAAQAPPSLVKSAARKQLR